MEVAVQKICCVCRRDVSQSRRTKDRRGNYYCTPCYTTLWELHCQRVQQRVHERNSSCGDSSAEHPAADFSGVSRDDPKVAVVPVTARRVKRRVRGNALRLSDLISDEALAEVEAARLNPSPEPEIPVSPITNLPVSSLIDDYAALASFGDVSMRPATAF